MRFEAGLGFDGSSIRGFKTIESSDMLLIADPTTAIIDPICEMPTLSMVCNVVEPMTLEAFSRDPRYVAQKSVDYMKSTGDRRYASYIGPEAEFFIFDEVYYHTGQFSSAYGVDSAEGPWNSGMPGHRSPDSATRPVISRLHRSTPCRICARRWSAP